MATKTKTVKRVKKVRFDSENSEHWHKIPSKGMLFALAIAAFNGADFPGADVLRSRDAAKAVIAEAKENGIID